MKTFVAISGSLKSTSANTGILKSLIKLNIPNVEIILFEELDFIPHFSPEKDTENSPASIAKLRTLIKDSNGVIICTPEYAFNLPGVLKNALDWCVSSGEFNEKPVLALSASPLNTGGEKALTSLQMTLTALGTKQIGSYSIPNINSKLNEKKELIDAETLTILRNQMDSLIENS